MRPGTINHGVSYDATGPLTVNVVPGTTITPPAGETAVLITGQTSSTDVTLNLAAGATINAPQSFGVRVLNRVVDPTDSATIVTNNALIKAYKIGLEAEATRSVIIVNNAPIDSPAQPTTVTGLGLARMPPGQFRSPTTPASSRSRTRRLWR